MATWTPETLANLAALWAEGLSTNEIGRRLGKTKNAVVGMAHRHHLPARPSPIRAWAEGAPPVTRRVPTAGIAQQIGKAAVAVTLGALGLVLPERVAPRPVIAAPPPRAVPVTPVLSRRPCCWPMWTHGARPSTAKLHAPGMFCGAPGIPGKSYCAAHGALGWMRVEPQSQASEARGL